MKLEEIGSYVRAHSIARCFSEAATLIYGERLKKSPSSEPFLIVSFVVNASFACELFLKALARRGGLQLKGHELARLLADLPVAERQIVDRAWNTVERNDQGQITETLESVIAGLSNSFVEWRYTHEKEYVSAPSSVSILHLLKTLEQASKWHDDA